MSKQYQKQKKKWFNAGKSQATKEILEKTDEIIDKWAYDNTKRWGISVVDVLELKQQLKKLGEEGK